ncbi:hypothetical protein BC834DRAFT_103873 [Gloeopeniophorella convolvens]|nr:hypothetical protein BC834DRAFT_103873 [Gloeopeniophorella convolvens]
MIEQSSTPTRSWGQSRSTQLCALSSHFTPPSHSAPYRFSQRMQSGSSACSPTVKLSFTHLSSYADPPVSWQCVVSSMLASRSVLFAAGARALCATGRGLAAKCISGDRRARGTQTVLRIRPLVLARHVSRLDCSPHHRVRTNYMMYWHDIPPIEPSSMRCSSM